MERNRMNEKVTALTLITTVLLAALVAIPGASAQGPATPNMLIKIFYDPTQEENALAAGDIDIGDWPLSSTFINLHASDPAITMDEYRAFDMFQFDVNNQLWPTGGGGGYAGAPGGSGRVGAKNEMYDPVLNPRELDAWHFRRAIAHLANKDKYTMGGAYELKSDVPFAFGPAPQSLENATAVADAGPGGYTYPYSRAAANTEFNLGHFITAPGHATSRFYDKNKNGAWDAGTDEELPNMKFWIRLDDPNPRQAGEDLYNELILAGIPAATTTGGAGLEKRIAERSTCFAQVMVNYDYNIYTGDWTLGADKDFLFDLYHSSMGQYAYGTNYPGFKNPEYDVWAERVKYQGDQIGFEDAQWVKAKYIPIIPLWSSRGVKAYRTGWDDVVNEEEHGVDNFWSFLRMNWIDGAGTSRKGPPNTIVWGHESDITSLNAITSISLGDWKVLDLMYDSLLYRNPYNLTSDVGLLATSWNNVSQDWNPNRAGEETVVTFTLRSDAVFHDGSPVRASDVAFSLLAVRDAGAGNAWNYPAVMDIGKIEISGAAYDTVKVFFNVESTFAMHWAGFMPIINKDLWWQALSQAQYGGYTHNIPDDTNGFFGDYTPGGYSSPSSIRRYYPWISTAMGNPGVIDLAEDGGGPWRFVNYLGQSVTLTAWTGFYISVTYRENTWSFNYFINLAFHEIGNVNWAFGYGVMHGWYLTDEKIDLFDLTSIAVSMPSSSSDTWGKGQQQYNPDADMNNDGRVDALDLNGDYFGKRMG